MSHDLDPSAEVSHMAAHSTFKCHVALGSKEHWHEFLSNSELAKVHLARALIMNPEVLVLQRPLCHYDETVKAEVMKILDEHVKMRGYKQHRGGDRLNRRPRPLFFSPVTAWEFKHADEIWMLDPQTKSVQVKSAEAAGSSAFMKKLSMDDLSLDEPKLVSSL